MLSDRGLTNPDAHTEVLDFSAPSYIKNRASGTDRRLNIKTRRNGRVCEWRLYGIQAIRNAVPVSSA